MVEVEIHAAEGVEIEEAHGVGALAAGLHRLLFRLQGRREVSGESMALEPTRQRRSKRPDRLSVEDPSFERELQRATRR